MVQKRLRAGLSTLAAACISAAVIAGVCASGADGGPTYVAMVCLGVLAVGVALVASSVVMLGRPDANRKLVRGALETAGMLLVTTPVALLVGAGL